MVPQLRVTSRAIQRGRMYVMPCAGLERVSHRLVVPAGSCPYSKNPLSGVIEFEYTPGAFVLEVVSLYLYVQWCGGGVDGAPMSVEDVALRAKADATEALGVPVRVRLFVRVNPGNQRLEVVA